MLFRRMCDMNTQECYPLVLTRKCKLFESYLTTHHNGSYFAHWGFLSVCGTSVKPTKQTVYHISMSGYWLFCSPLMFAECKLVNDFITLWKKYVLKAVWMDQGFFFLYTFLYERVLYFQFLMLSCFYVVSVPLLPTLMISLSVTCMMKVA